MYVVVSDVTVFVLKRDIKLQPTNHRCVLSYFTFLSSVLGHFLLGIGKSIRPVKRMSDEVVCYRSREICK